MAYRVHNFDYNTPTRLLFGRGKIEKLPEVAAEFGKKVLLVYGGGSIKKLGIYDKVKTLLADCEIIELSGVEPNPKVTSVNAGAKLCKEHGVDFVLAVGGGSVLDCAKAICAAAYYDGDAWDIITDPAKITKALPLVTVLTLAATGSEYDPAAVISNWDTNQKIGVLTPVFYPRVSICDPEYTYSVSKKQTAAGCADIMSHIFEQYCVKDSNLVSDGLCETVLRAVLGTGRRRQRLRRPRHAHVGELFGLQRHLRHGQFLCRLGLPRDRTRTLGLLRHHARRRSRDRDARLLPLQPQRRNGRPLCDACEPRLRRAV